MQLNNSLASGSGEVTNEQLELITSDPLVLHGLARVAGTRVGVVVDRLAAGMTEAEILAEHRTVRRQSGAVPADSRNLRSFASDGCRK